MAEAPRNRPVWSLHIAPTAPYLPPLETAASTFTLTHPWTGGTHRVGLGAEIVIGLGSLLLEGGSAAGSARREGLVGYLR